MAWTLQLLNADTTLDLNDGTAYSGRAGFLAPPPPVRIASGGANLFRHGSDIRERVYGNRTVTAVVRIHGTSQDNLILNINAINSLLERAAEYTTSGLGSQVKLRRKWEGATNQVDFHVLTGTLALGDEFSPLHSQNTTFANAVLTLICKPFAYGAEETVENDVADPGFEVAGTALADWTSNHTGSGTSARDTSVKKSGSASLKLVMTSSTSGQVIERHQTLAEVDEANVYSFQCWVRVDALNNCKVVMEADYNTGTDVEVSTTTVNASEFVKLTMDNKTTPAGVGQAILRLRLEATGSSATGTVYIDQVSAIEAAASATAWVSSRSVANSGADDGQGSVNFLDILDVPGDVPAELQVRILETVAHDEIWAGARHAGRMYDDLWMEGEDGTGVTIRAVANLTETPGATNSSANYSDGTSRESQLLITGAVDLSVAHTWFRHDFTLATPPSGQFRVLIGAWAQNGTGNSVTLTLNADDFQFGVGYTYGAFNLLDLTDPDTTSFVGLPSESLGAGAISNRTIIDLGTVTIPPVATPDNQTAASFVLSIFEHFDNTSLNSTTHNGQEWEWDLDFVMLMPVDFGANYVNKTSATDVVLLDSMSDTKGLYLLNSSDVVQSFPTNQLGRSPEAHPDGTRIYIMGQTPTTYSVLGQGNVSITYRPRFLHVMGA